MNLGPRIDLSSERGTTLVELLVVIPIALSVAAAIIGMTTVFSNNEAKVSSRSSAIEAAQVAFDRMTRDIRQASAIATTGGSPSATLDLSTMVLHSSGVRAPGTVTWSCATASGSVWTCSRTSSVTVSGTTTTTDSGPLFSVSGSSAAGTNNTIFSVVTSSATAGSYASITAKVPTRSPATSSSPTFTLTDSAAPVN